MTPRPIPVTHPAWCDRELCTAPEVRPTTAEYIKERCYPLHRSAPLAEIYFDGVGQEVYLSQTIAPWECNTYLAIGVYHSIALDSSSPLLWAVLSVADEMRRESPLVMEIEAAKHSPLLLTLEPRNTDAGPTPLVGAPIAGEREPAKIVAREGVYGHLYGDAELDGLACILCHQAFVVGETSVPAGIVDGGPQVFAHHLCRGLLHASMPGRATQMTRCGAVIRESGARTVLNLTDVTCTECQKALATQDADFAAVDAALAEDEAALVSTLEPRETDPPMTLAEYQSALTYWKTKTAEEKRNADENAVALKRLRRKMEGND